MRRPDSEVPNFANTMALALLMLAAEAAPCPFLASPSHALRGNPTNYNLPTDHPLVRQQTPKHARQHSVPHTPTSP